MIFAAYYIEVVSIIVIIKNDRCNYLFTKFFTSTGEFSEQEIFSSFICVFIYVILTEKCIWYYSKF